MTTETIMEIPTLTAAQLDAQTRALALAASRAPATEEMRTALRRDLAAVYEAHDPDLVLRLLGTDAGADSDLSGLRVAIILQSDLRAGKDIAQAWADLPKPTVICLRQPDGRMRATAVPFPAAALLDAMQAEAAQAEDPAAAMLGLLANSRWTVSVESAVEAEEYIGGGYDAHAALFAANGLEVPAEGEEGGEPTEE